VVRKLIAPPVTLERALGYLFGVAREADIPKPKRWTSWKEPRRLLPIDRLISKLRHAERGVRLLSEEEFDGRESPFGPTFCPYYTARLYLLRATGSAQRVYSAERRLDLAKARNLKLKTKVDDIIAQLDVLLQSDAETSDASLGWPRNLVLSDVDRQMGMIDLADEAARAAEVRNAVGNLKIAVGPMINASRLLSELLAREVSIATHEGRPPSFWDRTFIEEVGDLYRLLTNVEPARSKAFFLFVKSAYASVGRRGNQERQIKAALKIGRAPEIIEAKSSALILDDGRIYTRRPKSRGSIGRR
jgi:hypothetical protein